MKEKFLLVISVFFWMNNLVAQEKMIDSNAYKSWPSIGGLKLSDDGKYVMYDINNVPVGGSTLIMKSIYNGWEKRLIGLSTVGAFFLADSKSVVVRDKADKLTKHILGTDKVEYTPSVKSFQLLNNKVGEWIYYIPTDRPNDLVLKNLKNNQESRYSDLKAWKFSDEGNMLLLQKKEYKSPLRQTLSFVNLDNGQVIKIWEGNQLDDLILDGKHQQLAFRTKDSLLYYKVVNARAVCIATNNTIEVDKGLTIGSIDRFSKDGTRLFLYLNEEEPPKSIPNAVEVWSYRDMKLQSEQENGHGGSYFAVLNLENKIVSRLQYKNDSTPSFPIFESANDSVGLISTQERFLEQWNQGSKVSWNLVFTDTGKRKRLDSLDNLSFSFGGRYLIYFNYKNLNWFSYEISTGNIRNLTQNLSANWGTTERDDILNTAIPRGVAGWLKNDAAVLIYDQNDIWQLDPLNKKKPINITNGYGKVNSISFSLVSTENNNKGLGRKAKLYFSAFNLLNKNNGFYKKNLNEIGDPKYLTMMPNIFITSSCYVPDGSDFTPIKAKNIDAYVVRRMSATDAPNYFVTRDFKTFSRLTNLQPQKEYNWYTTELHSWKSLNGRPLQGLLYKPENFDPSKKYPVIFQYYERKSDGLNAYLSPGVLCGGCNIDIPTYVSNGYLVFSPDIYYKIGDPMQGTYDAVVSAAKYVSTLPFVDAGKMGIQGCSWGGLQTNYLVTHTNIFTAAVSSSSISNLVSAYGSLAGYEVKNSLNSFYETGQGRMGGSLWERPDAYIRSSPIFSIDKVTTPLLIMHTKNDGICSFSDAIQFFTGLRRMGKKAWMLAYSEGNHGLFNRNEANDFSLRMMQFFNHYLKDKPAPVWMLDSLHGKDRSWKAGLELDNTGRTPSSGILTFEEQVKVDSIRTRKPIKIILR